jgi:hypothetical protein
LRVIISELELLCFCFSVIMIIINLNFLSYYNQDVGNADQSTRLLPGPDLHLWAPRASK